MINTNVIPTETDRQEAKNQFDIKTKELGLKHTFSFDEAWDFVIEKRKKEKFKKDINAFEEKLKAVSGSLGTDPFPLIHTFSDGLYIRQIKVPPKTLTVTKIHKQEHVFFLMKGTISVLTPDGVKKYTAPFQGITKVGTKRVIYHYDEVIFTTVHSTDKKTIKEVELQVIANDFDKIESVNETEKLNLDEFMNTVLKEN